MAPRSVLRVMALCALLGALLSSGCATSAGPADSAPSADQATQRDDGRDSALAAYESALRRVQTAAPDALLLSVGSQGSATPGALGTWSVIFIARDTGHLWRVVVANGQAGAPEDLGQSDVPIDASTALDLNVVSVWAEQAVTMARAVAAGSGDVPPQVLVMGGFMELPGATGGESVSGIWKIAFTGGASMEGAREFTVSMVDGQILEVTE